MIAMIEARRRGPARFLLGACVGLGLIASDVGCKRMREGPDVTWYVGVANGEAAVAKRHKPALLFFGADWDMGSKELQRTTFADRDVRELLDHDFVAVTVDVTGEDAPGVEAAQRRFGIKGVPTILILAPDFKTELRRFTAVVEPRALAASLDATRSVQ